MSLEGVLESGAIKSEGPSNALSSNFAPHVQRLGHVLVDRENDRRL